MRIRIPTKGAGEIWIDDNSEEAKKIIEGYDFKITSIEEREQEKIEQIKEMAEKKREIKNPEAKLVKIGKKGKTDIKDTTKKVRNRHQAKLTLQTVESLEEVKTLLEEIIDYLPIVPWEEEK